MPSTIKTIFEKFRILFILKMARKGLLPLVIVPLLGQHGTGEIIPIDRYYWVGNTCRTGEIFRSQLGPCLSEEKGNVMGDGGLSVAAPLVPGIISRFPWPEYSSIRV